jgi:hypothetical protein
MAGISEGAGQKSDTFVPGTGAGLRTQYLEIEYRKPIHPGGGQKSAASERTDLRPSHSQIFFHAAENFRPPFTGAGEICPTDQWQVCDADIRIEHLFSVAGAVKISGRFRQRTGGAATRISARVRGNIFFARMEASEKLPRNSGWGEGVDA